MKVKASESQENSGKKPQLFSLFSKIEFWTLIFCRSKLTVLLMYQALPYQNTSWEIFNHARYVQICDHLYFQWDQCCSWHPVKPHGLGVFLITSRFYYQFFLCMVSFLFTKWQIFFFLLNVVYKQFLWYFEDLAPLCFVYIIGFISDKFVLYVHVYRRIVTYTFLSFI